MSSHGIMELLDNFIKIQHFCTSYPDQEYIILISHFKKKNDHYIGSNMPQSRNENVIYIKITKMYLPKYLLNCDRLLVLDTS